MLAVAVSGGRGRFESEPVVPGKFAEAVFVFVGSVVPSFGGETKLVVPPAVAAAGLATIFGTASEEVAREELLTFELFAEDGSEELALAAEDPFEVADGEPLLELAPDCEDLAADEFWLLPSAFED